MPIAPSIGLGDLVEQAQGGSDSAAQLIFDRCREPLLTVIRAYLSPRLRKLYDSNDFLQETFEEIFTTHFSHQVLCSPQRLWPYLKKIAENKVRDANRKHLLTQRHNITLDVSLGDMSELSEATSRELSPEDSLLPKELVEETLVDLLDDLPDVLRQIVQLVLQGYHGVQIADILKMEPKRVYRAISWLKRKIQE